MTLPVHFDYFIPTNPLYLPVPSPVVLNMHRFNNNNNEYLERLTRTGPKRLHVLYKYIFVKIQNSIHTTWMHAHMHAHTQTRTCTHTRTHTNTHIPVTYQGNQGNETEEKVFKERNVFKEDLTELTEVEWRTEISVAGDLLWQQINVAV